MKQTGGINTTSSMDSMFNPGVMARLILFVTALAIGTTVQADYSVERLDYDLDMIQQSSFVGMLERNPSNLVTDVWLSPDNAGRFSAKVSETRRMWRNLKQTFEQKLTSQQLDTEQSRRDFIRACKAKFEPLDREVQGMYLNLIAKENRGPLIDIQRKEAAHWWLPPFANHYELNEEQKIRLKHAYVRLHWDNKKAMRSSVKGSSSEPRHKVYREQMLALAKKYQDTIRNVLDERQLRMHLGFIMNRDRPPQLLEYLHTLTPEARKRWMGVDLMRKAWETR